MKATYLEMAIKQRNQPQSLAFGKNSKASREVGELYSGKKGKLLVFPGGWHGEAGGRHAICTRRRHPM